MGPGSVAILARAISALARPLLAWRTHSDAWTGKPPPLPSPTFPTLTSMSVPSRDGLLCSRKLAAYAQLVHAGFAEAAPCGAGKECVVEVMGLLHVLSSNASMEAAVPTRYVIDVRRKKSATEEPGNPVRYPECAHP